MQIYAPTSESRYDNEVEELYNSIKNIFGSLHSDNINLVIGDFNAIIGQGKRSNLVGEYDLGQCNDRGDRLFEFCQEAEMVITNTWFKLPKRLLDTWKSPLDSAENPEPIRNQIDYVLINKHFRNIIKRIATYSGTDIGSDHNSLVDVVLKLKFVKRRTATRKCGTSKLNNVEVREKVTRDLNVKLSQMLKRISSDINS